MVISPPNGEADWRNVSGYLLREKIWGVLSVLNATRLLCSLGCVPGEGRGWGALGQRKSLDSSGLEGVCWIVSSLREGTKYVLFISASIALSPMPRTKLVLNKNGQMNKSKEDYGEWGEGRKARMEGFCLG